MNLFELLFNDERKIILSMKKVKIFCISSVDMCMRKNIFWWYTISPVKKKVIDADYYENIIEIFVKWKVGKEMKKITRCMKLLNNFNDLIKFKLSEIC